MIVTLCGSYKFKEEMFKQYIRITEGKHVVLMPAFDAKLSMEDKVALHRRKIDMSDAIYVVDVDGYYGEHTKAEIDYAEQQGKLVIFMSKDVKGCERMKKPFSLILNQAESNKILESTYGVYTLRYVKGDGKELFKECVQLWVYGPGRSTILLGARLLGITIFDKKAFIEIIVNKNDKYSYIVPAALDNKHVLYYKTESQCGTSYKVDSWHKVDIMLEEIISTLKTFQTGIIF